MVQLVRPPVASKDIGGGDDLADEYDFELDPPSAAEDDDAPAGHDDSDVSDNEEGEGDEEGDEMRYFDTPEQDDGMRDVRVGRAMKRKARALEDPTEERGEGSGGSGSEADETGPAVVGEKKKKKKKKPKRPKLDAEVDIASAGPEQLASWWTDVLQKEGRASGLSALELEEASLPEVCFEDTSAFTGKRTEEALPQFIRDHLPKLATRIAQKPKNPGAPTCIILSPAALRAAELCRVLKSSGMRGEKGGEIAKLFAKHFKLSQHVEYLSRTRVSIAVATPGRLHQLLEQGALALTALSHVILDETHRDAKERTLSSIPEVRGEVVKLMRGKLGERIRQGGVQVVVY